MLEPLLIWMLFAAGVHSWTPCTDLNPLDLLDQALLCVDQVQVVPSGPSQGLRLVGGPETPLSFPASQIFTNCHFFPAEFSLVATVKIPRLTEQRSEFLFSLVADRSNALLLGLRFSENRLQFLGPGSGAGGRTRIIFQNIRLDDDRWHTLVLALTGPYAMLTVDCGPLLEIEQTQSFPNALSTAGSRFFLGSRGRFRQRFSGLLRQLVLVPGSDATPRLCPANNPSLSQLSVPRILQPDRRGLDRNQEVYETRVTLGVPPSCSSLQKGQLWLDAQRRALLLCDGQLWRTLLHQPERLDYLEDYQDLYTSSETFDVEVFSIPSEGVFMAAANRDSRSGSAIYQWTNGSFQLFQNISTREARAWKHFTIQGQVFLVVANFMEAEPQLSIVYRWSRRRRRFLQFQSLETHAALDWEFFHIHNHSFLVVANHRQDSNHNIQSVIYRWNPSSKMFEVNQTLSTSGAYDWEFFSAGPFHFLAVANTFDGRTTMVSSTVYVWLDGSFRTFQSIPTVGATDWEMFQIDGRVFLAVANSQKVLDQGPSFYSINSTIYELNAVTQTFLRFQDILTHSAVDWEFFTVGEEKFLVVANSHDGNSYFLNSVVYRWKGSEGFVPIHSLPTFGCRDWEFFSTDQGSFLIYSSATSRLSKVFRLHTY